MTTKNQINSGLSGDSGTGNFVGNNTPTITTPKIVTSILDSNGNTILGITPVLNAVNYINFKNEATGSTPSINFTGSDAIVTGSFTSKNGNFSFTDSTALNGALIRLNNAANTFAIQLKCPDALAVSITYILPLLDGGANTALVTDGGGNLSFTGNAVLGRASTLVSTSTTGSTIIPFDDTIPQITEGNEFMTLSYTPQSASSILVIEASVVIASSAIVEMMMALFQDSTANALAATTTYIASANQNDNCHLRTIVSSASTTARTYRIRCGGNTAGTWTFNGQAGNRLFGGVCVSSINIVEYAN